MSAELSLGQFALLSAYALGMAGGQILFKLASPVLASETPLADRVSSLAQNPYFLSAMGLYLALSVFWVWLLSFTPLSRAYPFVALALVLTPVLGAFIFSEPLTWRVMAGIGVIVIGLLLVAS